MVPNLVGLGPLPRSDGLSFICCDILINSTLPMLPSHAGLSVFAELT